ncbi:MAG TPA: PEP-CTERM sorting domain-containing protein [Fimbriimonadaceae bacterium]|nr:PEP-CTERM sorting domain-containing protein [Fimbriimonadaceae bacterium]
MFHSRLIPALAITAIAAVASAQSYNAFDQAQGIYGIQVAQNGLGYTVSLDPGAYLMIDNLRHDITDIFGFWSLSGTNALNGSGATQNGWDWNSHSAGGGYIAGWKNDPKNVDIQPGEQLTFTYSGLFQPNVEGYGFHLSLAQAYNGSNTAYFKGSLNPVPEPATLGILGVGVVTFLRRMRKQR